MSCFSVVVREPTDSCFAKVHGPGDCFQMNVKVKQTLCVWREKKEKTAVRTLNMPQ